MCTVVVSSVRRLFHPLFHLILVPLVLVVTIASSQQKKPNVAVLDFDARAGLSAEEAASLSDIFSAQLVNTGEFVVIDRNRVKIILQEQGFQKSEACAQVECIVDVGRILKVEKMFVGNIGKIGNTYNVNIQLIDVATAHIQLNKSRIHEGKIDELATEVVPLLAAEITTELTGRKTTAQLGKGSATWYWYVGGAVVTGVAGYIFLKPKPSGTNITSDADLPVPPRLP